MITAGLVGFVAVVSCQAKERKPKAEAPAPAVQQVPATPPVFTFQTEEEMQEFAKVWQQRQAALARMSVLQSYWNQEQESVQRITNELSSKYNLNPDKAYSLDIPRKALVEIEQPTPPAGQPAQLGSPQASAPASAPATTATQ
jgi:hypothetical protein